MSDDSVRKSRRVPSTRRGRALHQRLVDAGRTLFLERGYHHTSVAGICQAAGVSNGAYYQYFSDKHELFVALWNDLQMMLLGELTSAVKKSSAYGLRGRVEVIVSTLFELLHRERDLFQVFREAEFVEMETSMTFYRVLEQQIPILLDLGRGEGKGNVEPEALSQFVLGAVTFNVVANSVWGLDHHPLPTVTDFLLHGMAPRGTRWQDWGLGGHANTDPADRPEPLSKPERTRLRILDAAEELFGTLGYKECGTSTIAQAAGVGQGTLYRHFGSKEGLLEALVRRTNASLRAHVERHTRAVREAEGSATRLHRLRVEVLALRGFLDFIPAHPEMYRVVREAEFAKRELGRWYYTDLADDYRAALERAMSKGEVRKMNPLALALAAMGIGHQLGMRWPVWKSEPVPQKVEEDIIRLMMTGILEPA